FLFDALIDHQISPDPGSMNPFQDGALVAAEKRSYTVYLRPNGSPPVANSLEMPPATGVTLVMRVYLPEPGQDRLGGVGCRGSRRCRRTIFPPRPPARRCPTRSRSFPAT
ncbi:MAG TPA: hypothetical protein VL049_27345, partial [Candidatus Dormibacteraeota bacterium]|nr:hypothetical protein [Candidatus Dormibacteraeota bacterium]